MSKKMKRLLALFLSVLMVISLLPIMEMNVEAATKPKLAQKTTSIVVGGTSKIKVKNAPKGAKISYKSAKKSIATVSKKGQVKGVKAGTTNVTVSVKKNSKTTKLTCRVTVKKPNLSKSKLSLALGKTATLSVKNKPKIATYTWSSSNPKIVSVNKNGKVTAKAKGSATIKTKVKTAKKTYNLSCKVSVSAPSSDDKAQNYIVTFNSNGGSAVPSQTVKKNGLVQQPANPTRSGYTFNGWYITVNGGQKFDFKTAITANLTLYAHWDVGESVVPTIAVNNLSETETNNVDTEKIDVSGTASSVFGKIKEVTYSLKFSLDETASVTGKAEGTTEWTIKGLPLQVGTSFLTVTVCDAENRTIQKVITLNRLSTEIELSDNVVLYTEEQTAEIANDIIDYWVDDMGTVDDASDDQTKILFSEYSEIVQSIKNGLIGIGDVLMLQPCDALYLGFNGVLVSNEEPEDTIKYPSSEYEVVSFRSADYTDIFDGDVSLSYELVDTENPLVFACFPSEVEIYAMDDAGSQQAKLYSNVKSTSEGYGDQSVKQEISQPGFQKNALSYMMNDALNITGGLSGKNGANIGIKFKDAILYDEDGNGSTTNDQFKFGGSISFNHLKVDAGIEWHPNYNPFNLDLLPQQIIGKYSYTEEIDAHADWTGKISLNDVKDSEGNKVGLVQAANKLLNNDFENNKQFLGMTLSGVDMSDSIILGAFGLQIAPTGVAPVVGIKNAQYSSTFTPLSAVLVIMPVIDINGELSAKVGVTYKYTSYNEKGINMQKKDYVGSYGSLSENRGQSSIDLPFNRSLEIYNVCSKSSDDKKSAPAWSFALEGDGNAKAKVAVGADVGLMFAGIMPFSAEAKLYASSEVEGRANLSVDNEKGLTLDGLAKVDSKVGLMAAAHFKLALSSDLSNPDLKWDSGDLDLILWEAHLTSAYIDGTVFKADDANSEGGMGGRSSVTDDGNSETIADVTVSLIRTDQLGKPKQTTTSDEEGKYRFENVAEGKYKLTFSKEGYDTYETDEVEVSGTHKTVDVYLVSKETEKPGGSEPMPPTDDNWDTNPDTSGLYTYILNKDMATITGYKGIETDLNLPTSIEGYKVVGIAASAFKDNKTLVSVNIPGTIVNLGYKGSTTTNADNYYGIFQGNERLTKVTIQAGSEEGYIGNRTFQDCISLKEIEVPGNIKTIYGRAFYNCSSLESFTWSETTGVNTDQTIGEYAFCADEKLATVSLSSVKSIGQSAFLENKALKNLTLNEGLQTIEASAFKDCVALETVTIPSTAVNLGYKGSTTTNADNYYGIFQGDERLTKVTIQAGSGEGYIGNRTFRDCISLREIEVPGNIKTIYGRAFYNCSSLESFTWSETTGVNTDQTIGEYAFCADEKLATVSLSSVKSIGQSAFLENKALKNLTLNEGLQTIEASAFKDCVALETVAIPSTAVNLGYKGSTTTNADNYYGIFQGDERLTKVTIQAGSGEGYIGNRTFRDCISLREIEVPGNIKTIYGRAFYNCSSLESFTWSETTGVNTDQTIGEYAFYADEKLATVSLSSVKSIGQSAFLENKALKNLTLNEGLQTIEASAFKDCVALETVAIPSTAVNLGYKGSTTTNADNYYGIFQGDIRLKQVIIKSEAYIGNKMFFGCTSLSSITFEQGVMNMYSNCFGNVTATICYPASQSTWTSDIMQDYGGTITWVAK